MRILCMHKVTPRDEAGQLPPQQVMEDMGELVGEAARDGLLLAGDGLHRSALRLRLSFAGGRCEITEGPYQGDHELPERMVVIQVGTRDEAIDWARRFGVAVGAQRLELGPVTEAWDLGFMEKPADAPLRFMILQQASAAYEAGEPPTPAQRDGLRRILGEMQEASVLQFHETLRPSREGVRLQYRNHQRTRIDGPFTESKELIGGFCMLQLRSLDEMVVWADRFARILGGDIEVDVRLAADPVADA